MSWAGVESGLKIEGVDEGPKAKPTALHPTVLTKNSASNARWARGLRFELCPSQFLDRMCTRPGTTDRKLNLWLNASSACLSSKAPSGSMECYPQQAGRPLAQWRNFTSGSRPSPTFICSSASECDSENVWVLYLQIRSFAIAPCAKAKVVSKHLSSLGQQDVFRICLRRPAVPVISLFNVNVCAFLIQRGGRSSAAGLSFGWLVGSYPRRSGCDGGRVGRDRSGIGVSFSPSRGSSIAKRSWNLPAFAGAHLPRLSGSATTVRSFCNVATVCGGLQGFASAQSR